MFGFQPYAYALHSLCRVKLVRNREIFFFFILFFGSEDFTPAPRTYDCV